MRPTPRYSVHAERDPAFGVEAWVLHDHQVGSQARVLPSLGNNLIGFTAGLSRGPLEILLKPDPTDVRPQASHYGSPILFPFPNRVRDATYMFEGRRYHLEASSAEGHHWNGLVRGRPWEVVEADATLTGATVRSVLRASRFPEVIRQVPSPFTLTVSYTLFGNTVRVVAEARNVGARGLPMGFGLHPHFRVPLAREARPYDCTICVPAARLWRLDHAKIPTGQLEAVPPELDFRACTRVGDAELDHLYGAVSRERGLATCNLVDRVACAEISVRFGREFPALVVFAPADRPTISFAPYSCITNAVNMPEQVASTGLVVLPPGGSWHGTVDLAVVELAGREDVPVGGDNG